MASLQTLLMVFMVQVVSVLTAKLPRATKQRGEEFAIHQFPYLLVLFVLLKIFLCPFIPIGFANFIEFIDGVRCSCLIDDFTAVSMEGQSTSPIFTFTNPAS